MAYIKKEKELRRCYTCGKEFWAVGQKISCKSTHSPSHRKQKVIERKLYKIGKERMPKWVNKNEVAEIYLNRPKDMVVDHIIPLNHPEVSGLHVPWNLQYITEEENNDKGNKFDGTMENDSWKVINIKK